MSDLFYQSDDKSFTLYDGDCLDVLPRLKSTLGGAYADLVFADPPYYLSNGGITCQSGRMVSVNKGKWDKSNGAVEDHLLVKRWLEAVRDVMKNDATVWITGTQHIIYSIGFGLQELHFKLLNDIIWVKPAPPPNLACRTFTHCTEIVLWAARNDGLVKGEKKSRYKFNYKIMKELNGGKQMKSYWGQPPRDSELTWLPASELALAHRIEREEVERIEHAYQQYVQNAMAKKTKKKTAGSLDVEHYPPNVFDEGAPRSDEKKFGKHPTQKPLALLRRIIEASSDEGDVVVDPFNGTGATGIMSALLKRRYIGIDSDKSYLEITKNRYLELKKHKVKQETTL